MKNKIRLKLIQALYYCFNYKEPVTIINIKRKHSVSISEVEQIEEDVLKRNAVRGFLNHSAIHKYVHTEKHKVGNETFYVCTLEVLAIPRDKA